MLGPCQPLLAAKSTDVCPQFHWQFTIAIRSKKLKEVCAKIADKKGFYNPADLLKEHPMEK
jgi:hypothetical protein